MHLAARRAITWTSDIGTIYRVESAGSLASSFDTLQADIAGEAGETTFRDTGARSEVQTFHRVATTSTGAAPVSIHEAAFHSADFTVRWNSEYNQTYYVERAADATASYSLIQDDMFGEDGSTPGLLSREFI